MLGTAMLASGGGSVPVAGTLCPLRGRRQQVASRVLLYEVASVEMRGKESIPFIGRPAE